MKNKKKVGEDRLKNVRFLQLLALVTDEGLVAGDLHSPESQDREDRCLVRFSLLE